MRPLTLRPTNTATEARPHSAPPSLPVPVPPAGACPQASTTYWKSPMPVTSRA